MVDNDGPDKALLQLCADMHPETAEQWSTLAPTKIYSVLRCAGRSVGVTPAVMLLPTLAAFSAVVGPAAKIARASNDTMRIVCTVWAVMLAGPGFGAWGFWLHTHLRVCVDTACAAAVNALSACIMASWHGSVDLRFPKR
jgi:hypothetical protein